MVLEPARPLATVTDVPRRAHAARRTSRTQSRISEKLPGLGDRRLCVVSLDVVALASLARTLGETRPDAFACGRSGRRSRPVRREEPTKASDLREAGLLTSSPQPFFGSVRPHESEGASNGLRKACPRSVGERAVPEAVGTRVHDGFGVEHAAFDRLRERAGHAPKSAVNRRRGRVFAGLTMDTASLHLWSTPNLRGS